MNATRSNRHGSAVVTLPSDTEILITRRSTPPPRSSSRPGPRPSSCKRWWGFETWHWLVCDIDLRVGGTWR